MMGRSTTHMKYASGRSGCLNNRRLLEPIGNIPPAEAEARYYAQEHLMAKAA